MPEAINLDKRIVTFIGPEGSGKTTLAKRLAQDAQKPYITIGDILRDLSQNDPGRYGDECRAMFKEHRYLDPNMLLEILVERYRQEDTAEGFIVDGGLRTVTETAGYGEIFRRAERDFPMTIVHLRIPGWMSIQRLVTGNSARKRIDDTYEGVFTRLSKYYDHLGLRTALARQQPSWSLIHVNAMGTMDETYQKLCVALS